MTDGFTPADGERARWRHCYDMVVTREPDEEITYREVMETLDCDQGQAIQSMLDAKRHLEQDKQRTIRNVPRFGWVVLSPSANLVETEKRIKKSARAVDRAARVARATPRDELSQIDRARLDFQTRQLLAARGIYERKSRSFSELERESKRRETTELPIGRQSGTA